MEARLPRAIFLVATLCLLGASYRTPNFIVSAPDSRLAEKIGRSAEQFRRDLAIAWLGRELPRWQGPCPITANVAPNLGAGGATSFVFRNGQVGSWRMTIQGSELRILDSVLPHEVTHTVFATHFRQPLPRWADEGACTTVEHTSEKLRHQKMLIQFLQTNRGIAFSRMFAMKEYPHDVLPLYAQGYSLARFLIEQGGRRKYVEFVGDGLRDENWVRALNQNYSFDSLTRLQNTWLDWVRRGSPSLQPQLANPAETPAPAALVSNEKRTRPAPNLIYHVGRDASPAASGAGETGQGVAPPTAPGAIAATAQGWQGAGGPSATPAFAPGSINRTWPLPNRHQAVRQQPIQRPQQQILR